MLIDLSEQQLAQLVGNGECFIHHHPREVLGFSDRRDLMNAAPTRTVSGNTTLNDRDEIILVDTSAGDVTVTLPLANKGREYQVVKMVAPFSVFIAPTAPDTILGSTFGVKIERRFTSLHFKAITGGYILL